MLSTFSRIEYNPKPWRTAPPHSPLLFDPGEEAFHFVLLAPNTVQNLFMAFILPVVPPIRSRVPLALFAGIDTPLREGS